MIELKLKEAQDCLNKIGHLVSVQAREYASDTNVQRKQINTLGEEKRRLNAQVNELIIASNKHEKENTRIMFAGLFYGVIAGAAGAIIWMSYL